MDGEIERFFFFLSRMSSKTDEEAPPIILLSGPANSGKTSLLFQYAFNSAAAAIDSSPPQVVVFICKRPKLEMKPPLLSLGVDPSSPVFQLIHFKYVEDLQGLVHYFAALHLHHHFPLTVIVDDFGLFFHHDGCNTDFAMLKTLALCCNAIIHANQTGNPCKLLLSDTHQGDMPKLLYIYKRWVSSIFNIKGGVGDSATFLLHRIPSQTPLQNMRIAKYSIALQQLVLQGFPQDTDH